uniref:Uncharacterized protein n=1 Tax=Arundo donax TaxID=35708 RepID=A0A0A9EN94_ARUDO
MHLNAWMKWSCGGPCVSKMHSTGSYGIQSSLYSSGTSGTGIPGEDRRCPG